MQFANFEVDPRLATLLGESYRSTEQAIKELVDNAWDADAERVCIFLPQPMSTEPIHVKDDGSGMVEGEIRQEYLRVARDRRASKGDRTPTKRRLVKGRKYAPSMVMRSCGVATLQNWPFCKVRTAHNGALLLGPKHG